MIFLNVIGNFAKFLKIKIEELASKFLRITAPAMTLPTVKGIQVDAALDPGADPVDGDSYILTNVADLNANFGVIANVGDGDIVRYDETKAEFEIVFDASENPSDRISCFNLTTESHVLFSAIGWFEVSGIASNTWTPTKDQAATPLSVISGGGTGSLDGTGYIFTNLGGGTVIASSAADPVTYDNQRRGFAIKLDALSAIEFGNVVIGVADAESFEAVSHILGVNLVWNGVDGFTYVYAGDLMGGNPQDLGALPYALGDELFLVISSTGLVELWKNGVKHGEFTDAAPGVDLKSIAVGGLSSLVMDGNIIQAPIVPNGVIQYQSSAGDFNNYPANRAGKAFIIDGVAPGGITSPIGLLTNGVYVFFDLAGVLSDQPSIGQHLTKALADQYYQPYIKNNYGGQGVPGASNDASEGYSVGSKWIDVTVNPKEAYVNTDASLLAAVWEKTTLTLDELGSMALKNEGAGAQDFLNNADRDAATDAAISAAIALLNFPVKAWEIKTDAAFQAYNGGRYMHNVASNGGCIMPNRILGTPWVFEYMVPQDADTQYSRNIDVGDVGVGAGDQYPYLNRVQQNSTQVDTLPGLHYLVIWDGVNQISVLSKSQARANLSCAAFGAFTSPAKPIYSFIGRHENVNLLDPGSGQLQEAQAKWGATWEVNVSAKILADGNTGTHRLEILAGPAGTDVIWQGAVTQNDNVNSKEHFASVIVSMGTLDHLVVRAAVVSGAENLQWENNCYVTIKSID